MIVKVCVICLSINDHMSKWLFCLICRIKSNKREKKINIWNEHGNWWGHCTEDWFQWAFAIKWWTIFLRCGVMSSLRSRNIIKMVYFTFCHAWTKSTKKAKKRNGVHQQQQEAPTERDKMHVLLHYPSTII